MSLADNRQARAMKIRNLLEQGMALQGATTLDGELIPELSLLATEVVEDYPKLVEELLAFCSGQCTNCGLNGAGCNPSRQEHAKHSKCPFRT